MFNDISMCILPFVAQLDLHSEIRILPLHDPQFSKDQGLHLPSNKQPL